MVRDGDTLIYGRRFPARFDVSAQSSFPMLRRGRLAMQIRQDLWRELQSLRGFSPAIEVRTMDGGVIVRAGGSVDGRFPKSTTADRIQQLLDDPKKRVRWINNARLTEQTET